MRGRPRDTSRDENIRAMYEAGMTLEQIGKRYDVTRERIRQILRRIGVPPSAGGVAKRAATRMDARLHALDVKYLQRHGVDFATLKVLQGNGGTRAWREQRRNALNRGIGWHLSLGQWWGIWQESGKWERRGRGKGKYCLARYADRGDYVPGNVWVCEFAENCREAKSHAVRGAKNNIHYAYPGTAKPWLAKHSRKYIGFFATREEAEKAKAEYTASLRAPGGARGWTLVKKGRRRYKVQASRGSRRYEAFFLTQAEAEAAYQSFVREAA